MNNKLKYCFFIIIFSIMFIFIANTQCYASCTESIPDPVIGFDGSSFKTSGIPSGFYNWNHYIVLYNGSRYYIYAFNDSLEIVRKDEGSFTLIGDEGLAGGLYEFNGSTAWGSINNCPRREFSKDCTIIYCCDCMMQYKDDFSSGNFFGRPLQGGQGILPPIIQVTPLKGVLKEIIAVLPIVLMTIVGLIGLRKALAFLSTVLHRS